MPDGLDADPGPRPFGEDLERLEELSQEVGIHALEVPEELIEDDLRRKSRLRRTLEIIGSAAVVVAIFALIIPWATDADYARVWEEIRALSGTEVAILFALWGANLLTVWAFLTNALPGLKLSQAAVLNLSGSAVANVVPFGGAVGVGATFAQTLSWGFDPPGITLAVVVSGVWNVFAKLAFPIIALGLLAATGSSAAGLNAAAFAGLAAVSVAVALFAAIIGKESAAAWIGDRAERAWNRTRRLLRRPPRTGLAEAVLTFRQRSVVLVKQRWPKLTMWMVAYKLSSFLIELLCVRALGIGPEEVSWVEVLAAYALGELLSASPLTPAGVGIVELGNAGLLIQFGAPHDAAIAAVLLFRAFDYLFEIPAGGLAWLVWATKRSWRQPPGSRAVSAAAAAP